METVIPASIVVALVLLAALTISERALTAQEAVSETWREVQERVGERARTDISPAGAETTNGGARVEITLRNDGDTKLADFDRWDVILQYESGDVRWYPYDSGLELWEVEGIYSEGAGEVFDPDILNPGEEIVIWVHTLLNPAPAGIHRAIIATPNGITASTVFTN